MCQTTSAWSTLRGQGLQPGEQAQPEVCSP